MRPSEGWARKCALALYAKQLEQYLADGGVITLINKKSLKLVEQPALDINTVVNTDADAVARQTTQGQG